VRRASTARSEEGDRLAALGTLAAGVAHEINNPLTYVMVNLEHVARQLRARIAAGDALDQEEMEAQLTALGQAIEGATRVRSIVRDLMTFSGGHVESKSPIDPRRVLEAALQMAAHELRPRARVEKRLHEVPFVLANEARLGQVFLNVIINAARAIAEGDAAENAVTVETDADDEGRVIVTVTDTGAGIAREDLSHVCDPFFTRNPSGESAGLGLSVAHGIVASLGGSMTLESAQGKGTKVRIVLPCAPGYGAVRRGSGTMPAVKNLRTSLLVIDDDPMVARAIARSLADEHDVDVCTDGKEGLERITGSQHYDVILCDLMMPDITGVDFYREVLRLAPDLAARIVFMTGGVYTPRTRAFALSFPNRCIEKPPDAAKLREIVRRHT
jgi:CheY-like chemotaxis protein